MNRLTKAAAFAGAAVLSMSVAACGGDSDVYCNRVQAFADGESLDAASMEDPETHDRIISQLEEIAGNAPEEIQSDWTSYTENLRAILDQAADGETPATADMDALRTQSELVGTHASEQCDIEL